MSDKGGPAAGGFPALGSSIKHLYKEKALQRGLLALARMNQPGGFDCPGCAWPEPGKTSHTEFCENGAKAIAAEATEKKIVADFFKKHSVTDLAQLEGYELEQQGRLTEPMSYNPKTDHYEPIRWDDAFQLIGRKLQAMASPDNAVLYTSGRTSNEAAFLYQLFGRELGTNNFPDCSNMCHESSGVALNESIGTGKGTVSLEDFHLAEAIFIFGQNPGTNHPRMLTELETASKRGCHIVVFNPLKERGLERFLHPQHVVSMALNQSTPIASLYLQPIIGGDFAALKGLIKAVLEADKEQGQVLDQTFLREHTAGFSDLTRDIDATPWKAICEQSGLTESELRSAADIYIRSKSTIACWAMGLTQNRHAVLTIQYLVNLMLLKGNLGRPGAGLCPVRGHSNVQGDRTMGIMEKPGREFLSRLEKTFDFTAPRKHGYHTVEAIKAMQAGKVKVFIGMGGNFAAATPDSEYTETALRKVGLIVNVSTKLNRSHLIHGEAALILPCLGRSEKDLQQGIAQKVTVEDSMSMVHASQGRNPPASKHLRSEPAIVAGIARAALPHSRTPWEGMANDYGQIRDKISEVVAGFSNFNSRILKPSGFYLGNAAREREWQTPSGKANFTAAPLPLLEKSPDQFRLMTIRSHDQYNTTIYGLNDRYRGVAGTRKVIFLNTQDMHSAGLIAGEVVDLVSSDQDGAERRAVGFAVEPYAIPQGCAAAYFPETNVLVPIDSVADKSHTPTSKYILIRLEKKISPN